MRAQWREQRALGAKVHVDSLVRRLVRSDGRDAGLDVLRIQLAARIRVNNDIITVGIAAKFTLRLEQRRLDLLGTLATVLELTAAASAGLNTQKSVARVRLHHFPSLGRRILFLGQWEGGQKEL